MALLRRFGQLATLSRSSLGRAIEHFRTSSTQDRLLMKEDYTEYAAQLVSHKHSSIALQELLQFAVKHEIPVTLTSEPAQEAIEEFLIKALYSGNIRDMNSALFLQHCTPNKQVPALHIYHELVRRVPSGSEENLRIWRRTMSEMLYYSYPACMEPFLNDCFFAFHGTCSESLVAFMKLAAENDFQDPEDVIMPASMLPVSLEEEDDDFDPTSEAPPSASTKIPNREHSSNPNYLRFRKEVLKRKTLRELRELERKARNNFKFDNVVEDLIDKKKAILESLGRGEKPDLEMLEGLKDVTLDEAPHDYRQGLEPETLSEDIEEPEPVDVDKELDRIAEEYEKTIDQNAKEGKKAKEAKPKEAKTEEAKQVKEEAPATEGKPTKEAQAESPQEQKSNQSDPAKREESSNSAKQQSQTVEDDREFTEQDIEEHVDYLLARKKERIDYKERLLNLEKSESHYKENQDDFIERYVASMNPAAYQYEDYTRARDFFLFEATSNYRMFPRDAVNALLSVAREHKDWEFICQVYMNYSDFTVGQRSEILVSCILESLLYTHYTGNRWNAVKKILSDHATRSLNNREENLLPLYTEPFICRFQGTNDAMISSLIQSAQHERAAFYMYDCYRLGFPYDPRYEIVLAEHFRAKKDLKFLMVVRDSSADYLNMRNLWIWTEEVRIELQKEGKVMESVFDEGKHYSYTEALMRPILVGLKLKVADNPDSEYAYDPEVAEILASMAKHKVNQEEAEVADEAFADSDDEDDAESEENAKAEGEPDEASEEIEEGEELEDDKGK